jgi:HSP20 family protein
MREIDTLRRDMEKLFGDTFEPFNRKDWLPGIAGHHDGIVPNVDMLDKKNEIVVKAQLAGVEKDDVDLTITRDSVTIKGEIRKEEEERKEDYYCSECTYGSFKRTIPLPVEIDMDKAKAVFKNGVLKLILPKLEEAKTKETKIKID